MKQMTYMEFFEKAKSHNAMKSVIIQCFITAIKMVIKTNNNIDVGDLVLNTLSTMTKTFNGIELTDKDQITAEYMSGVLNQYSDNAEVKPHKGGEAKCMK